MPPNTGLSPLARGNPVVFPNITAPYGPIPARAGEPKSFFRFAGLFGAYPRSRGGTSFSVNWIEPSMGLSPLARGNRDFQIVARGSTGPIPARAGEPMAVPWWRCLTGAYPRSRGGTNRSMGQGIGDMGLSPLARGNLYQIGLGAALLGPIPARAGEPMTMRGSSVLLGAYPRSRGGTTRLTSTSTEHKGLSPLARGNLNELAKQAVLQGPIPARAGEPAGSSLFAFIAGAYPRSRGGTLGQGVVECIGQGLSPLARGNQSQSVFVLPRMRPIPARAGEPEVFL